MPNQLPVGTCMCGKANYDEIQAKLIIASKQNMNSYYKCPLSNGFFHVTKIRSFKGPSAVGHRRFKFNKERVLRELKEEMARQRAVRQRIVEYMQDSYERHGTTEFSSSMVVFAVQQTDATINKSYIHQEISKLKNQDKLIVSLNKTVPNQKGAKYFTLASILEKETEPEVTEEIIKSTPKAPVENPFDKVNEQLKSVHTRLDHVVDLVAKDNLHEKLNETAKLLVSVNKQLNEDLYDKLSAIHEHQISTAPTGFEFDGKILENHRDSINDNLRFFAEILEKKFDEAIKNADGRDSYREGFKDGIKFAIEMGLKTNE